MLVYFFVCLLYCKLYEGRDLIWFVHWCIPKTSNIVGIKYIVIERVGVRRKQTGKNGLLSRYVLHNEDKTVMNEYLCIVLKYIKKNGFRTSSRNGQIYIVGDYDTYILVLDRKNKDIDHLNYTS